MAEFIPFFQGEKRSITEKLAKYFEYSDLKTKIHYDEEKDVYILSVQASREKEAKKQYQAFYFNERERVNKEKKDINSLEEIDESNIITEDSLDKADSLLNSNYDSIPSNDIDYIDKELSPENNYHQTDTRDLLQDSSEADSQGGSQVESEDDSQVGFQDDSRIDVHTVPQDDAQTNSQIVSQSDNEHEENDMENEREEPTVKSLLSGSGSYIMKSDKYKDYTGTFYIFLILGITGIIFVILNIIGLLSLLNGFFPNLIMGALFIFFIYVAISTGIKAKKLKYELEEENQLTDQINKWLNKNITNEFLASISDPQLSDELDYIKKTETICDMLIKEFGDINRDYLDILIEDFYNKTFETTEMYNESE